MTDCCDCPPGDADREGKADAPAIAAITPVRRLLRAFFAWLRPRRERRRLGRLHRLNDHQLSDIGLEQLECEDGALDRLRPLILPLRRRDDDE